MIHMTTLTFEVEALDDVAVKQLFCSALKLLQQVGRYWDEANPEAG
jgi:hypothetical protein